MIKDSIFPTDELPRLKFGSLIFADEKKDLRILVKRFKWIDNDQFLFASRDGVEKRYKIDYFNNEI